MLNRDWTKEMEELRTLTRVTELRRRIECREEGAWTVVQDITLTDARGGTRRVTSFGRASRSFTRSVSHHKPPSDTTAVLVEYPDEAEDPQPDKRHSVEIVELSDEPSPPDRTSKKTSVVTLGKGNIVVLGSDEGANFRVTSLGTGGEIKGSEQGSLGDKKSKRVGFCKTEVHFTPESGKFNIVETDEKPPPTQIFRRKKRAPRENLPKTYFGATNNRNTNDRTKPLNNNNRINLLMESPKPLETEKNLKFSKQLWDTTSKIENNEPMLLNGIAEKREKVNNGNIENYLANRKGFTLELAPMKLSLNIEPSKEIKYLGSASPKLQNLIKNSDLRPAVGNSVKENDSIKNIKNKIVDRASEPRPKQTTLNIKMSPDPEITVVERKAAKGTVNRNCRTNINNCMTIQNNNNNRAGLKKELLTSGKNEGGRCSRTHQKKTLGQDNTVMTKSKLGTEGRRTSKTEERTQRQSGERTKKIAVQSVREVLQVSKTKEQNQAGIKVRTVKSKLVEKGTSGVSESKTILSESEGSIRKCSENNKGNNKAKSGGEISTVRIRRNKEPLKSFEKVSNGWVGHCITRTPQILPPEMSGGLEELSMTGSYSEICQQEEGRTERPSDLPLGPRFLSQLEGTVTAGRGGLISFVADDLENKIKLSSPRHEEATPAGDWSGSASASASLVSEIECEALRVAASVDSLTENLSEILHGVSALTVDCLEAYRDVVCKASDAVDLNIKSMYQLVAKTEELSKSMRPLYGLADHVKKIKHLLDLLEAG